MICVSDVFAAVPLQVGLSALGWQSPPWIKSRLHCTFLRIAFVTGMDTSAQYVLFYDFEAGALFVTLEYLYVMRWEISLQLLPQHIAQGDAQRLALWWQSPPWIKSRLHCAILRMAFATGVDASAEYVLFYDLQAGALCVSLISGVVNARACSCMFICLPCS